MTLTALMVARTLTTLENRGRAAPDVPFCAAVLLQADFASTGAKRELRQWTHGGGCPPWGSKPPGASRGHLCRPRGRTLLSSPCSMLLPSLALHFLLLSALMFKYLSILAVLHGEVGWATPSSWQSPRAVISETVTLRSTPGNGSRDPRI